MTLCPIAVVAGCRKCPAFGICPLKGVIGDYKAASGNDAAKPRGRPSDTKPSRRAAR